MMDVAEVMEALKKEPNNPNTLRAVAEYYLARGNYKLAKNHYYQATILYPRLFSSIVLDYEAEIAKNLGRAGPRFGVRFHRSPGRRAGLSVGVAKLPGRLQ